MTVWNPWHGCISISEGCDNCFLRTAGPFPSCDTTTVRRTLNFNLPLQRMPSGAMRLASGADVMVCHSSDFFIDDADPWRDEAWGIIRRRPDVAFRIVTRYSHRIAGCLPSDWGEGYDNVMIMVSCENQFRASERIPDIIPIPAARRGIVASPLIAPLNLFDYLATGRFCEVICSGEVGPGARPCRHEWVHSLSEQCRLSGCSFRFIDTGSVYIHNHREYHIDREVTRTMQAFKSGLSHDAGNVTFELHAPDTDMATSAEYPPHFRKHCDSCGSRRHCYGCSDCGMCDSRI